MKFTPVAEPSMIPVREGKRVIFGKKRIALFNLGNEFVAINDRCPHKAGPLSDGIVCGKQVTCPLHNLSIDLESGCALGGEKGKVKVYPTQIIDGKVCVAFEA